jgi:hypothetical protein
MWSAAALLPLFSLFHQRDPATLPLPNPLVKWQFICVHRMALRK